MKGLKFKKKGVELSVRFKAPLQIDYEAPAEQILAQIMEAIEQSKEYMMKGPHHWKTKEVEGAASYELVAASERS